jgi:hypothetical protein
MLLYLLYNLMLLPQGNTLGLTLCTNARPTYSQPTHRNKPPQPHMKHNPTHHKHKNSRCTPLTANHHRWKPTFNLTSSAHHEKNSTDRDEVLTFASLHHLERCGFFLLRASQQPYEAPSASK